MPMYPRLFAALNDAQVTYVVVGGLAVVLHGHARMTVHVDLVVDLASSESRKTIDALVGLGLKPRLPVDPYDFADEQVREGWRAEKNLLVFTMFDPTDPLLEVDLFIQEPIPMAELLARSSVADIGGATVRFAAVDDLIAMKEGAGRPRDIEDIAALKEIRDGR